MENENVEQKKHPKISYLNLFIPLISLIMVEFASRGAILTILLWPFKSPLQFIASLGMFYAVYLLLWLFLPSGEAALYYSVIWIGIAGVVGCKRFFLGVPLMPWEVSIAKNMGGLMEKLSVAQLKFLYHPFFLICAILLITGMVLLYVYDQKKKISIKVKVIGTVAGILIVTTAIFTLPTASLEESPVLICEDNGYARGFIINAKLFYTMNHNNIETTAVDNYQYDFKASEATDNTKPNIIFVMNETFWDVTKLSGISFSQDPIKNYREISKECISGEMISPMFGGGTSNIEFEVMTGFSLKYLPPYTNAYLTSITKQIPAIPAYLKTLGYKTVAVHPYESTFFNRNTIYPLLGIDRFITQTDMPNAKISGDYISDDSFVDYIISEYEKSEKPIFMYNISMQNHWPFSERQYPVYDVEVDAQGKLEEYELLAVKNYVQGLHEADMALKKLVDYFKTVEEPTIIVFFGDHLPILTAELGVYGELGFYDESLNNFSELFVADKDSGDDTLVKNRQVFETPYLIWSNYQKEEVKEATYSANYLGIRVLKEAGLELPPFYNYLIDYSDKEPVNRYNLCITSTGIPSSKIPPIFQDYENIYTSVQNDILFGEQKNLKLFTVQK